METDIKIKTPDKKLIYGTLCNAEKKSDTLVIFVHGFTGHQNEHIFFNGARFFFENGFDSFRFNLYSGGKNSRNFREVTISKHGEDISTIVKYFCKKYKNIFVVGHSYGGTSLLFVDQVNVSGFVFWDASYITAKDSSEQIKYNKGLDAHILDWGMEIIVGKKFITELKKFPDCGDLISKINVPVKFITANEKGNSKAGKKYFASANTPKELVNIDGASHNFDRFSDEQRLFDETLKFIKKTNS
jgi:esterase/lipase